MKEYYALEVKNISVKYGDTIVLDNVSFVVPYGVFAAIIGPNGAGKTTLLKTIMNLVAPLNGLVRIFSQPFNIVNKKVAYIAQHSCIDWDFPVSVYDVVLMGRYAYLGWAKWPRANDYEYALNALQQVDLLSLRDVHIAELSGGQRQRMFIARALAQNADLYLLDEPFAAVDKFSEALIVDIFKKLARSGKTLITVHHDFSSLERYFDWLIVIDKQCRANGWTSAIMRTPVANVYTFGKN